MIDIIIMTACVVGLATIAVIALPATPYGALAFATLAGIMAGLLASIVIIRIIAKEHEEPVPNPFTPWSGTNGSADSLIDPQDDTNSNYDRSRE